MSNLAFDSATRIANLVRAREISALEVIESALDRIAAINPRINAIVHVADEQARDEARRLDARLAKGETVGPLAGVPLSVKDLFEVKGMPSTSGTLGRANFLPPKDATVIERLRRADAIVIGKTNVPEFGLALETTNLLHGTTKNPYDVSRTPGGSSGGAAAALAAGLSALEVASDGGGSIRVPAHFCGVSGFKPTHGSVSKAGHFPTHHGISGRLAGYGPMARSVQDLVTSFRLMRGEDPRDPDAIPLLDERAFEKPLPSLRVAFHTDNGIRKPTPETVGVVERCALALDRAGAVVESARMPMLEEAYELHLALLIVDKSLLAHWAEAAGTKELHPWVADGFAYLEEAGADFDSNTATLLNDDWQIFRAHAAEFMADWDVLVGPVAPWPAPPHGGCATAANHDASSYASLHNLTGYPAAVVRCGTSPEGLPLGVQIAGKPFRDELVLDIAARLEAELGGFVVPGSIG
jgi:amidase